MNLSRSAARMVAATAAVCGALAAGCGGGGGGGTSTIGSSEGSPTPAPSVSPSPTPTPVVTARLRALFASPNAGNLDVLLDEKPVAANIPYRTATTYVTLPAGAHTVRFNAAGTGNTVLNANVSLAANTDTTLAVVGDAGNVAPVSLTDDNSAPASGAARVRVLQASPAMGAVDVYITAKDADILAASPAVNGVAYRAASNYVQLPAGTYEIRVTPAGTKNIAIDALMTMTAGQVVTIGSVGDPSVGQPLEAIVFPDR